MNLYSVLLVDDEEEVFQLIIKKLDWERMGFRIAGYARNGVEALEIAEELQVDVVMSDIKMPYMDGLTLCKKLKELYQSIKVIIFSGFDEFEYAKEAIKIEAEEYILKPINASELREVFERIRGNLDRELDEKRNIDKLTEYYMESLPVLQENFYTSLIEGQIASDAIGQYAKNYQISLSGPFYVVTILHISSNAVGEEDAIRDATLLSMSVKKLAEESLAGKWDSRTVTYLGDIIVITQLADEESITHFTDRMDRICKMAKRVCKARVTAGIGHICNRPEQLIIRVEDEIKHAKNYMNIQKVRYKNIFSIKFFIDDDVLECCTVKLIVQPLLENAIYYGVEYMDGEGEIEVRGYRRADDVYIEVADNGLGMPEETMRALLDEKNQSGHERKKGSGVGLLNVHNRIRLRFGAAYGVEIESQPDEGTTVRLHLPYIPFEAERVALLEEGRLKQVKEAHDGTE